MYCHLEGLRSSLSSTLHLTQLAATTHSSTFFRPILPPVLTHYLDNFKIGGGVLGALNMVREEASSFLFRPPVLVEQVERVACVREEEALVAFLDMLEGLGRDVVLVGVDEGTVGLLMARLKAVDRARVRKLVAGYTWWRRVLKYSDHPGYRCATSLTTPHATPSTLELEEFHQEAFPTSTPAPLATAPVVASILREAVTRVAVRQRLLVGPLVGRLVAQVAIGLQYRAEVVERQVEGGREALEVINSFRPDVPLSFAVDKMDQVDIDSGSENEEVEEVMETVVISDDDPEEEQVNVKVSGNWKFCDMKIGGKMTKRLACPVARCTELINHKDLRKHLQEVHSDESNSLVAQEGCATCRIQQNNHVSFFKLSLHVFCEINKMLKMVKNKEDLEKLEEQLVSDTGEGEAVEGRRGEGKEGRRVEGEKCMRGEGEDEDKRVKKLSRRA